MVAQRPTEATACATTCSKLSSSTTTRSSDSSACPSCAVSSSTVSGTPREAASARGAHGEISCWDRSHGITTGTARRGLDVRRELEGDARLADARRARDRDDPFTARDERCELLHCALAPDERASGRAQGKTACAARSVAHRAGRYSVESRARCHSAARCDHRTSPRYTSADASAIRCRLKATRGRCYACSNCTRSSASSCPLRSVPIRGSQRRGAKAAR